MSNVLQDILTAADDVKASRDTLVADTAKANAIIRGPATGGESTVDLGGATGSVKTLARTLLEAAGRVGLQYRFSTATDTTVDPGAGKVTGNNADLALVTELAVSALDVNGLNHAARIVAYGDSTTLLNRARVFGAKLDASAAFEFRLVGAPILAGAGAFVRLPVAVKGTPSAFANLDELALLFVPTGDRGGNNWVLSGWFPGDAPPAGGEALLCHEMEADVLFAANFVGCRITSKTPVEEDAVYQIVRKEDINDEVGTVIGTATIAEGEKVAVFSGSEVTVAGDKFLEVQAPDPPVAGISDLNIRMVGTLA